MKKIGVFWNAEQPSGCDYYRAVLPVRHLQKPLAERDIAIDLIDSVERADQYDAVMVHRHIDDLFTRRLLYLVTKGKRVLWDHDDLMTDLPLWNPLRPFWKPADTERWEVIKHGSTHRSVSTQALADLSGLNPVRWPNGSNRTFVLPNLIDLDDYLPYVKPRSEKEPVRIVWAGSETHSEDLKIIAETIRRVLKEFGDRVEVRFFGYLPNDIATSSFCQVFFTPKCDVAKYSRTLCALKPDIGLCPLVDHPFNRAKSSCKALEFAAAGSCVVYSNCPAYSNVGFGDSAAKEDDWSSLVEKMVRLPSRRAEIREYQHAKIGLHHSWQSESAMKPWLDAFTALVD